VQPKWEMPRSPGLTFALRGPQRMGALPASRRIALARLAGKVPSLGGSLSSKGLGRNGGRSCEVNA
jgi:hypothetical protein